jgi:hypothetical protein
MQGHVVLTTAQGTVLGRSVVAFRDRWDLAGVMTYVDKLAADPRPWNVLWVQVVTRAADPKSLTPEALMWPLVDGPSQAFTPPPRTDDPACEKCGSQTRRQDGTCHGCYLDQLVDRDLGGDRPAPPPFRPTALPPADFRQRVEAVKARGSVAANVPERNTKED